jgi:hypothetical protein
MSDAAQHQADRHQDEADPRRHPEPADDVQPATGQQIGTGDPEPDDDEGNGLDRERTGRRPVVVEVHHAHDEERLCHAPHDHGHPARDLGHQGERRGRQAAEFPEGEHEDRDRGGRDQQGDVVQRAPRLSDRKEEKDGHSRHQPRGGDDVRGQRCSPHDAAGALRHAARQ